MTIHVHKSGKKLVSTTPSEGVYSSSLDKYGDKLKFTDGSYISRNGLYLKLPSGEVMLGIQGSNYCCGVSEITLSTTANVIDRKKLAVELLDAIHAILWWPDLGNNGLYAWRVGTLFMTHWYVDTDGTTFKIGNFAALAGLKPVTESVNPNTSNVVKMFVISRDSKYKFKTELKG